MGPGRRRPGLYADIPVPVLQVPAKEEGGPRDLPNILKEEEKEEGEEEKKEDGDDEEEWEEKRRDELQGSLMVEKGIILKFPLVFFATCLLPMQLLPTHTEHKIWQPSGHVVVCNGFGKKCCPNNSINRHTKLVCGKPHHRKSFCIFFMWGTDHH